MKRKRIQIKSEKVTSSDINKRITTGIPKINQHFIGGFKKGEMMIIAPPAQGKSMWPKWPNVLKE